MRDSISCRKKTKLGKTKPGSSDSTIPIVYSSKGTENQTSGGAPWYPQIQWETSPTIGEDERPIHILSITAKVPPAHIDTGEPDPASGDTSSPSKCSKNHRNRITRTPLDHVRSKRPALSSKHRSTSPGLKEAHEK